MSVIAPIPAAMVKSAKNNWAVSVLTAQVCNRGSTFFRR